jgi:hypothetical protein
MHVVEISVIPHVTPGFFTINYGRAPLGALPMSHSRNPHTNLLNVFIQIANNKGILYINKICDPIV